MNAEGAGINEQQRTAVLGALVDRRRDGKTFVKAKHLVEPTGLDSRTIGRVFGHLAREGFLDAYRDTSGPATVWTMVGPLEAVEPAHRPAVRRDGDERAPWLPDEPDGEQHRLGDWEDR